MKNLFLATLLFAAALCGASAPAHAVPLVIGGSSYTFYLSSSESASPTLIAGQFDGLPSVSQRDGLLLTLTESETDLGGGRSRITVDLRADGDLFPTPGEDGFFGLGSFGTGLQFTVPVTLESAQYEIYIGNLMLPSGELIDQLSPTVPWDGTVPSADGFVTLTQLGGAGVNGISFVLEVQATDDPGPGPVPEPATLLLIGIGAGVFAAARRRRQA